MLQVLYLLLVVTVTVLCQAVDQDTFKSDCNLTFHGLWFSPGNSCVVYVPQLLTWNNASNKCLELPSQEGITGRLAVILNKEAYKWYTYPYEPQKDFAKTGDSWFGLKGQVPNAHVNNRSEWAFMVGNKVVAPWNNFSLGALGAQCPSSKCEDSGVCMKLGVTSSRTFSPVPCSEKHHAICELLVDTNNCKSNPCMHGGTCQNRNGGYECICKEPEYSGKECQKYNGCVSNPCKNAGKSSNQGNSYVCGCRGTGYSGKHCQTDIDECISGPCAHGSTCQNEINRFVCICKPGFTGTLCRGNIYECESKPCLNGGKCLDVEDGYKCGCVPDEFNGTNCENDINTCRSSPCLNGATCKNDVNRFSCKCAVGYEGPRCDKNIDECSPNPCQNAGVCTDAIGRHSCKCSAGYTGRNCEKNIDECLSNPCVHGGTCNDKINSFNCTCVPGYTGKQCEKEIDECNSSPCENGGNCLNEINKFSCRCLGGYAGVRCQTDIDECLSNPCVHGGTCHNEINRFICKCVPGYTGNQCEKDIDECLSNPCVHGGTCQDKINSFNCTCVPGYTGNQCETDINECASDPCNNGATCIDKVNNFTCNCAKLYVGILCETDCHWTTWSKAETCHKEGKNCVRQLTRTSKSNVSLCKPSKKDTETTEKCDKMDCHRMSSTERIITAVLQSIGCIWLLALIAVTFVTCLVFKARNLERLLHACEEIVLFIGHLFILFLREATWSHTICMITSIGLQYTMISLFVFFVLEALQQYAYLTNVQLTGNFLSCRTNLFVGFGLPLFITAISAAFWAKDYPAEWSCWLNLGHTLSAGSIVPLLFCSLLTIIILEAATMGHYEALLGVDKTKRLLAKVNHKALLFILPITIAHWITGMYSVYEQYISMYTLVFGLNIALGVLIFIFHGLTHGAVNKYFLKLWRKGRNNVEKVVNETPKANADTSGNAPVVNEVEDLFKWAMNGTLADKKRAKEILFGIKADPLPSHEAISSAPQQPLIVLQPEPKAAPVISEADKAEAGSLFKWAMNGTMADKNQAKQLLFGATISPHFIND